MSEVAFFHGKYQEMKLERTGWVVLFWTAVAILPLCLALGHWLGSR